MKHIPYIMDSSSLITEYKQLLRSLNPVLPRVIEHLVAVNILARTESSRLVSTSDQFNRLCEQLASKGFEKKAEITSKIKTFRRSLEQQKQAVNGNFAETHIQHTQHIM